MRPHGSLRGRHQGSEGRWEAMRARSSRPFCSCDSRRVNLGYLSAGRRYMTYSNRYQEKVRVSIFKRRCRVIWRSNEPQVRTLGVGGHGREETFLGKEAQVSPCYDKGLSVPNRKPQRSFSAKLTLEGLTYTSRRYRHLM